MDDFDAVIALMDEAVAWLVAQGRSDQWGSEPYSAVPRAMEFMRGLIEPGDLFIGEIDGEIVGALIVNPEPLSYVPPVEEPELYVRLLVTSRRFKGRGLGLRLIAHAKEEARRREIALLRVDCYASRDEKLIGFYEGAGFTRTERLAVGEAEIPVQVFEMRLDGGVARERENVAC